MTPNEDVVLAQPQVANDLDSLQGVHLGVQVADPDPVLEQVRGQVLGHLLGQGGDQNPLLHLGPALDLVHQVVDLVARLAHLDLGVDDPGRADDLLHGASGLGLLEGSGGSGDHHQLLDALEELVELQRPVVDRRRQPEAVVDQRLLARAVTLVHAADLGNRLVGFVDEDDEVVGEVVDQRVRRAPRRAAVEDAGVVLDSRGESELLDHLDVVEGSLPQPVGLELLALQLQLGGARLQLRPDLLDRALDRLVCGDVVGRRPDGDVVNLVEDLAGQRVEVLDPLYLVAEELDPVGRLGVCGHDLQHLATDPEAAAGDGGVVALVLHLHQLAQHVVAVDLVADPEQLHLLLVELRRADPVDAGDRGDYQHVPACKQRRRRRVAEPVDLVVDRGVLLDVEILRRDVGLGLVVVVVADEVLDRVLGEELPELVAELRRQRLVVGDHQARSLHGLDHPRHRERLAGAGGAEQRLEALARAEALGQSLYRLRLVGGRRVGGVELEIGHPDDDSGAISSTRPAASPRGSSRRAATSSSSGSASFREPRSSPRRQGRRLRWGERFRPQDPWLAA